MQGLRPAEVAVSDKPWLEYGAGDFCSMDAPLGHLSQFLIATMDRAVQGNGCTETRNVRWESRPARDTDIGVRKPGYDWWFALHWEMR